MERPGTPEQKAETPSKNRNSASCAVAMGMVVGCRGCDGVFFFPCLFFWVVLICLHLRARWEKSALSLFRVHLFCFSPSG